MLKPPLSSTSNAPHSSAFLTFEKQAASLNDLDIVRKIVEREGCLEALTQLLTTANKRKGQPTPSSSTEIDQVYPHTYPRRRVLSSPSSSSSTTSPMVVHSLLDQLRSVSIQIVEAIEQWRATSQTQVFQWRQINYLLKMTSDLNFLATAAVHVDALQQLPQLERNPFLAPLHLDHPALREKFPDAAIQLGVYVGSVDMERIFYASKALLRELEAEKKRKQLVQQQQDNPDEDEVDALSPTNGRNNTMAVVDPSALSASKHQPQQQQMRVRWSNQEIKGSSVSSLSSYQAKHHMLLTNDSSGGLPPRDRKEEVSRDLELCRELILHAEHELGAIREEVAILQEKLADTLARPERRRELQNKIGALINALKFRSGDLYQRKNELRRKEAVYRLACERGSAGSCSSGKLSRSDRLARSQSSSGGANGQCENGRRSPESSQSHPYLSAVESALQEDELRRQEIVEKFMTLAEMRAVAAASSTSRQKHKQQQLTRNARHASPSPFKPHATGSFSAHSQAPGQQQQFPSVTMTTDEVSIFIDSLDLSCSYGSKFRSHGIDGALLLQATDRDLEEIGVAIRLHRVRILEAIEGCKALKSR